MLFVAIMMPASIPGSLCRETGCKGRLLLGIRCGMLPRTKVLREVAASSGPYGNEREGKEKGTGYG
jgi:hypothetical protein